MNIKIITAGLFTAAIFAIGCNHYTAIQSNAQDSSPNGKSHNAGEDCMKCHHDPTSGASSEGKWWYFAGTAYSPFGGTAAGGRVELWSDLDSNGNVTGKLYYSVPVDKNGNFYSSKIIDFGGGFYPRIVSSSGTSSVMLQKVTMSNTGCNSCHGHDADGNNQARIIVN
jgi:hypothetical protein